MSPHRPLLPFSVAVSTVSAAMVQSVDVMVQGPGHHARAARAAALIGAVSSLDVTIVVSTDLRPRLAVDMRALLDAGATAVRLEADGLTGELVASPRSAPSPVYGEGGAQVRFVLTAGPLTAPEVIGTGDLASAVRAAIETVAPPAGPDG